MTRGALLLLAAAMVLPRAADACSHRCDVPAAAVAYPPTGVTVPSNVEVVVQWRGVDAWSNPDPIPLEGIELRTDAGELVPVTFVHEAWANGSTSTLLVRPATPLPAGVYKVFELPWPWESEEVLLSTFVVDDGRASPPLPISGTAVTIGDERRCAIRLQGHSPPTCCYGETQLRRIDLDVPDDVPTISIEEDGVLLASRASAREAWGIAVDNRAALETCTNAYYPWLVPPGGHELVITPFAADGTRGEPIERMAVATVGGCSVARPRGASPLALLALLGFFLLTGRHSRLSTRRCRPRSG